MRGRESDYEIVIPISVSDRTAKGIKSVNSNVERMRQQASSAANPRVNPTSNNTQKLLEQERRYAAQVERIHNQTARQAEQQDRLRERSARQLAQVQIREAQRAADSYLKAEGDKVRAAEQSIKRVQAAGRSLMVVGGGLSAALTLPLVAAGKAAIESAVKYDSLKRGLFAVEGSAEAVEKRLVSLREVAKLPGLGFREAIQGSIRLQAVGFSAQQAERYLIAFGNAVAFTGGGKAELERITIQLGQMASKSKILSQDLRPIIEAAPAVGKALKDAFGTVDTKQLQELGLSTEQFMNKMVAELEKLPKMTGGIQNELENFADTVDIAFAKVGKAILPAVSSVLSFAAEKIEGLVNAFASLPPGVQKTLLILGGVLAIVGPLAITIGGLTAAVGFLQAQFLVLGGGLSKVAGLLTLTNLGWIAVAAGIGIALYAILSYESASTKANNITMAFIESQAQTHKEAKEVSAALDQSAMKHDNLNAVIGRLDPATQAYIKSLKEEGDAVTALSAVIDNKLANSQAALQATLRITSDGIVQQSKSIKYLNDNTTAHRMNIDRSYQLLKSGITEVYNPVTERMDNLSEEIKMQSEIIVNNESSIASLNKELTLNIDKNVRVANALGYSRDAAVEFLKAGGMLAQELEIIAAAYDRAAASALRFAGSSASGGFAEGFNQVPVAPPSTNTSKSVRGGTRKRETDELKQYKDILADVESRLRTLGNTTELAAVQEQFFREGITSTDDAIKKNIITIYESALAKAKELDTQKASKDVSTQLASQLVEVRKRQKELSTGLGEGATEVQKFNLRMEQARLESTATATALDENKNAVNQLREAWRSVDAMSATQKTRANAEALSKSIAEMTDQTLRSLAELNGKGGDTHLQKFIEQLSSVKEIGLTLSQLDPLKNVVESVKSLPEPARLQAIGLALERIINLSGARPRQGMTDAEWDKFVAGISRSADATATQDATEQQKKSADQYSSILTELNGKLDDSNNKTERSRIEKELEGEAYANLSTEMREQLLLRASEVDAILAQRDAWEMLADTMQGYADSIEDIFGGALGRVLNNDFKGAWQEIKSGFNQLWKDIVVDYLQSRVREVLSGILNSVLKGLGKGGTATASGGAIGGGVAAVGGGGGGGIGSLVSSVISRITGGGSSNASSPASVSAGATINGSVALGSLGASAGHEAIHGAARTGMGASIAGLLPMLGLGAGASLGGGFFQASGAASGIGSIAGGALGLSAGLAGYGAIMGGFAGLGSLGGIAAGIAGALPFIAPIAGALLIGAYFMNRDAQRKKDEKTRDAATGSTRDRLWAILAAVQTDQMTGTQARSEIAQLHSQWVEVGNGIKDSKTKRHHMETWSHFAPIIGYIEKAASEQTTRANNRNRMRPVFADGGSVASAFAANSAFKAYSMGGSTFSGLVPGSYDRKDDKLIRVTGNEVVLTPDVWRPISGYLQAKRVPGLANGGTADGSTVQGGLPTLRIESIELIENEDGRGYSALVRSQDFADAVVGVVRKKRRRKGL